MKRSMLTIIHLFFGMLLYTGCDVMAPPPQSVVVQMFVESDSTLTPLTLHETFQPSSTVPVPITDADVLVWLNEAQISFSHSPSNPGTYLPRDPLQVPSGSSLELRIAHDAEVITASTSLPPRLAIDSVLVVPTDAPFAAVYSTNTSEGFVEGHIYLLNVIIYWTRSSGDSWWIRARLDPPSWAPTEVVDLALLTDDIRLENELADPEDRDVLRWQGTYVIAVDAPDAPLPAHTLNLAVLRSGLDYARFALYQQNPEQGMTTGNVRGGVGIVAGISTVRQQIRVEP